MSCNRWLSRFAIALGSIVAVVPGAKAGTVLTSAFPGPTGHGGFIVISDPNASWTTAEADAKARGGYLATLETADQQTFLQNLLAKANVPSGGYWLGLHETNKEGQYQWLTKRPLNFTHWLPNQPDNNGGNENSVALLWSQSGQSTFSRRGFWNDVPDTYPNIVGPFPDLVKAGYVVEFLNKSNVKPTGSSSSSSVASLSAAVGAAAAPTAIPLPAALAVFPLGAAIAGYAGRRMRRQA